MKYALFKPATTVSVYSTTEQSVLLNHSPGVAGSLFAGVVFILAPGIIVFILSPCLAEGVSGQGERWVDEPPGGAPTCHPTSSISANTPL